MKIVINTCYGGFGLSVEAIHELIKMGSTAIKTMLINKYDGKCSTLEDLKKDRKWSKGWQKIGRYWWDGMIPTLFNNTAAFMLNDGFDKSIRSHPDVIKIVKKMGKKANGQHADLKIVEIPNSIKWYIDEYDGIESIHEEHTSWS